MPHPPAFKRSPLHTQHAALGARMTPFAGWEMPVQFAGILAEHAAVRTSSGVFDISHMGQFLVSGVGAADALDRILTNRTSALTPGEGQYSLLLNEIGGVIDDLIVYRLAAPHRFLLIGNAAKSAEDAAWIRSHLPDTISFDDAGPGNAGLAVQGPHSPAMFALLFGDAIPLPPRNHIAELPGPSSSPSFACRTGYTGEDGFELFGSAESVNAWFASLIAAGVTPCGLGARDTLRLEMCYPLNGSDLSPLHSPIEAGLGFFVDLTKPYFVGKPTLVAQKQNGPSRRLAAILFDGKSPPPRPHCPVLSEGQPVGELSSASLSPSLRTGIGMAYLPAQIATPGTKLEIDIRGKLFPASVVKKPFLNKSSKPK